jgi:glycosyltransferase involved in cell wall biosynthesis
MMAAYFANVPLRLHTVAGLPLMEVNGFKRQVLILVEKLTYKFATNVYPNSKGLYDLISSMRLTEPLKLKIIATGSSNGINVDLFDPNIYKNDAKLDLRNNLEIPDENFVFIFVGRLVKDKGINELINAFTKLLIKFSKISLLLVGPYEEELDPLKPETLNIISSNSNIHCLGYQEDVRPYFAISDALVFPSYREGFPNVVMQAGAMGLPSIVTNINGCNEIISDEINGLIIPVKDMEAIYEAMKKLLLNPNLFAKNADEIRAEIVSKYDRKKFHVALLQEYRRLEAQL